MRASFDTPILVVGTPRSGTSMVTRALSRAGVFVGVTRAPDKFNPVGYFENDPLTMAVYRLLNVPLGTRFDDEEIEPEADKIKARLLRGMALETLEGQGYEGGPWAYKEPATVLWWSLWHAAFPKAKWLVCLRDEAQALASLMRYYNRPAEACLAFLRRFSHRCDALAAEPSADCFLLSTDVMAGGDSRYFGAACAWAGVSSPGPAREAARKAVRPDFWHPKEAAC